MAQQAQKTQTAQYNKEAVDRAIEAARRTSKVSGREAKMIHALLRGRT